MKHKQIVVNNKIVYANRFLRWGEAVWDFIYGHVLPVRTWYRFVDLKDRFKYAMERAFTGFDRRISWGTESTVQFYKRLLSDLIENAHGFPSFDLSNICPEHWKSVDKEWKPRLLKNAKYTDCYTGKQVFKKGFEIEKFEKDVFNCWLTYLNYVLHCFMEADPDTCSLTPEYEALLDQVKPPFDEADRKIVEHNGVFMIQYPSKPFTPEEEARHKRMGEIDQYQTDMLMKGMAEVAKNIIYLND